MIRGYHKGKMSEEGLIKENICLYRLYSDMNYHIYIYMLIYIH